MHNDSIVTFPSLPIEHGVLCFLVQLDHQDYSFVTASSRFITLRAAVTHAASSFTSPFLGAAPTILAASSSFFAKRSRCFVTNATIELTSSLLGGRVSTRRNNRAARSASLDSFFAPLSALVPSTTCRASACDAST